MSLLTNYHVHTEHSVDAEGSVMKVVAAARRAGIRDIALTDHLDFVPEDPSCGFFDPDAYLRDVAEARREARDQIVVRSAVELGIEHEFVHKAREVAYADFYSELDFVIGSVHAVEGALLSAKYYRSRNRKQSYEDYFCALRRAILAVRSERIIDVVGHVDLVKRYAPAQYRHAWLDEVRDVVTDLMDTVVESGLGIEINVSGLIQAPQEQFPALDVLRIYRQQGGEILTIGSDSHSVTGLEDCVSELRLGRQVALAAGFRHICTFARRRPSFVRL